MLSVFTSFFFFLHSLSNQANHPRACACQFLVQAVSAMKFPFESYWSPLLLTDTQLSFDDTTSAEEKKKEKRQGQTGCRRIKMECQFVTLPLCALLLSFLNLFSFPFFFFNSLFQGSSFLLSLFGSVLCVSHSALWFCIFLLKKKKITPIVGFFSTLSQNIL